MPTRRRAKQTVSLADRLAVFAQEVREKARGLAPGREKEALLKKLGQADRAAEIERWANSPELQPPVGEAASRAGEDERAGQAQEALREKGRD